MTIAISLLLFIAVFVAIFFNLTDRKSAVLSGAGALLVFGSVSGFYTPLMALEAIYFETLALIFGMSVISSILARSGLFSRIAAYVAAYSLGNGWWILILFSLVTYGLSLLINNLSTMVVILPITLTICRLIRINPVPVLIAEIISSNLGGASTMVGDFPNMIISSVGDLHFLDFIGGMMVPCLFLLAIMLLYFQSRQAMAMPRLARKMPSQTISELTQQANTVPPMGDYLRKLGLALLLLTLIGFLLADTLGIRPAWVAFCTGLAGLFLGRFKHQQLSSACGSTDIIFFAALFVMVGALDAANILDGIVWLIDTVSLGNSTAQLLALMWIAAVSTIFLNAGAATAFYIPVAATLYATTPDPAIWWALSLGVLAGSSAALTGATAGSIAATQLEQFLRQHPDTQQLIPKGEGLDFRGYLSWGLPIMGIFLSLSSLYILVIAH